jgi:hypothetical protein
MFNPASFLVTVGFVGTNVTVAGVAAPTVSSVDPATGALAGGTTIVITGTGFSATLTGVTIGGTACTSVVRDSATQITCVTPAKAAAAYSIVVTNIDGQTGTLSNGFTYSDAAAAPTVSSLTNGSVAASVATSIGVIGTGFSASINAVETRAVGSGGAWSACTSVVRNSATSITCTTPTLAAGSYDVRVTNSDTQTGTGSSVLTSVAAPTVSSVSPTGFALAGGSLTINGTNYPVLANVSATVGGTAVTNLARVSAIQLTCTAPAKAAGSYDVVVTNTLVSNSGTLSSGLAYAAAPAISTVTPSTISDGAAGTSVTLAGTDFVTGATVSVNGNSVATSFTNSTSVSFTMPTTIVGTYNVIITNPDTQTGTKTNGITVSDIYLTNLSAYLKLNENTGTSAADSAGSHTGTLTNSPSWNGTGKSGSCVDFVSGSSQYIALASPPICGNNTAWTISVWAKTTTSASAFVYCEGSTSSNTPRIAMYLNENAIGDIECAVTSTGSTGFFTTTAVTMNDGNWHHICVVQTSKSARELFIDGVSRTTDTTAVGTLTLNTCNIGVQRRVGFAGYFTGSIDQFRIYSTALTSTQVNNIKLSGV